MPSFSRWWRSRRRGGITKSVNLVEMPRLQAPRHLGLDTTLQSRPWSANRLAMIFREAARHPSRDSLREARHARHCLSAFWLVAPVDLLPDLYAGSLGDLQRDLLAGPLPQQDLAGDEKQWRDQLCRQLDSPQDAPDRVNLLLALMPYLHPGVACLPEPLKQLPDWLLHDYANHCDEELKVRLSQPVGYLRPSSEQAPESPAELSPLSNRRGQEAMAWFEAPAVVNRMAALINLYGLESDDQPTREELASLRDTIAQLWLDVSPEQLEALYRTPVGTVTRSLIVSGFAGELVQDQDLQTRQWLASQVEDLRQPRAINALLAALLYFPPGKVSFEGGFSFIPQWLQQELRSM